MEKRYESDLTQKEKRQLEREKIKNLKGTKKIGYLVTYYWYVAVILVFLVLIGFFIRDMYVHARTKEILSVAIIDANTPRAEGFEPLQKELLDLVGTGDKYEDVLLDTATVSSDIYQGEMKVMLLMSADTGGDLIVSDETVYNEYKDEGVFLDWKDVLGEDYEKYEPYMTNGVIDLSKAPKWQEQEYTLYEPAYLNVLEYTEHMDNVLKFLEYFCS